MEDLLKLDSCRPEGRGAVILDREVVTPLVWKEWDQALRLHPDQQFRAYISDGIRNGFRLGFDYDAQCKPLDRNMRSAIRQPEVVEEYLAVECGEGRIVGPLDPQEWKGVMTSSFGVIPKGNTGKWRLIVDLSAPEGRSVNDAIRPEWCSLSYCGVEDAAKEIKIQGQDSVLTKIDIKSAYRVVPVHPEDRWLLGMKWDGKLFVDTTLPFGLRSAPKIFTAIADAAEWIVRQAGVRFIIHYLDDFLTIGTAGTDEGKQGLVILLGVFRRLGLPVAEEKLEGPCTSLTFLGVEIDTHAMELRLPQAKLRELQVLITSWQGRKSCKRNDLESLTGKLSHACKVVQPGKTFMRRMFELLKGTRQAYHHIRLNAAFRADLMWWARFLHDWNGLAILPGVRSQEAQIKLVTDASGSFGCGALWHAKWFQWKWSPRERDREVMEASITFKELLPIVIGGALWGPQWRNLGVVVQCDNQGAVAVVNTGYSKVPQLMHLVRCLFFIRATFQFTLRAIYIPGQENILADAISRDNLNVLFSQVPEAKQGRCMVPQQLVDVLVGVQPDWASQVWSQQFVNCLQQV